MDHLTMEWTKDLGYMYTKKTPSNPTSWYDKNMLLKDFMSNVNLSLDGCDTLKDDPLVLDEKEDQRDPFKFPIDDPSKDFCFQNF
jgi:hypothetical protein